MASLAIITTGEVNGKMLKNVLRSEFGVLIIWLTTKKMKIKGKVIIKEL